MSNGEAESGSVPEGGSVGRGLTPDGDTVLRDDNDADGLGRSGQVTSFLYTQLLLFHTAGTS